MHKSWKAKNNYCPNRSENPIYQSVISKKNFISKLKFKCIKGCGAELLYDNIIDHYNSNCTQAKFKIIANEQIKQLRKNNKKIKYMSSKYYNN